MVTSEEIVDLMINAMYAGANDNEKQLFREALLALVRFARAEQIVSIHRDFQCVNAAISNNKWQR
jgi:hypothetical protein